MDQLDIAIHQTAHGYPGGLDALAKRMGLPGQVLRNKANPNDEAHKLSLREALALIHLSGDLRILEVFAAECGCLVRAVDPPAEPMLAALLHAEAEHGDVSRAVAESLADGKLTPREKARVLKEISESQTAMARLYQSVMDA